MELCYKKIIIIIKSSWEKSVPNGGFACCPTISCPDIHILSAQC